MVSLLCPSRRPDGLARLLVSADLHAKTADWLLYAYVDEQDAPAYNLVHPRLRVVRGRRQVLSHYWNVLASLAVGDIFGMMGDDIVIQTPGWDAIVEREFAKFEDRIAFVYGRDGLHDQRIGTHGFLHRRWVEAVGHMTGPYFSCDWADNWIHETANMVGRAHFVKELYTEHMHPAAGKAEWDEGHLERMERGRRDNTPQLFIDTLPERQADARILRKLLGTTP